MSQIKGSAGIEPLKTCIRIWWKIDGKRYRETLADTLPTETNIARAKELANAIKTQIEMGIFDRDTFFPNSPKRAESYFEYYITQWQKVEQNLVAESTWRTYQSKVDNHIRDYWGKTQIAKIKVEEVERWVYDVLVKKKQLATKTIREILTLWQKIWSYWSRHQQNATNPVQFIKLNAKDKEDIHPFTRAEAEKIIALETDATLKNLWTVMLWSGLSTHELLPLAIEDVDLVKNIIHVKRGFVQGNYRVTKNRRRARQVEILPTVVTALAAQSHIIQNYSKKTITVTERDHRSTTQHTLSFFWYNEKTDTHFTYAALEKKWKNHLDRCNIPYRALNNGRHTFASQVLSTGAVPAEWLAKQLGHANTDMIHKHYAKYIPEDSAHIIQLLAKALEI